MTHTVKSEGTRLTWLLWQGSGLGLLAVAAVGLSAYGTKLWTNTTRALISRLEAARIDERAQSLSPAPYQSRELDGSPAPAQRFFRAAFNEGQPIIAGATHKLPRTMTGSDER